MAATFSDPTSSQTSGIAAQLATAINANSGTHGAYANAFNKLTSNNVGVWAMSGSVSLNGVTITVKSSLEAFVKAVNEEVADVTATANADGTFTLFNDSGDPLATGAGGGEASIGLAASTTYQGFIELYNLDGSAVKIEAGSTENGYGSSAAGLNSDVQLFGFNEGNGSTITGGSVGTELILASDDIKINGVSLGTTSTDSAKDKATAINAISASTNVTATASSVQVVTLTGTYTGSDDATLNGVTVDMTGNTMLDDTITSINTNMVAAGLDIVATGDSDGNLVLTSLSGANIITNDGATGAVFGTVVDGQGTTITATAGNEFITRGKLTLTSTDGSIIKLTDGTDANSGLTKLGLTEQSEFSSASETGLSV